MLNILTRNAGLKNYHFDLQQTHKIILFKYRAGDFYSKFLVPALLAFSVAKFIHLFHRSDNLLFARYAVFLQGKFILEEFPVHMFLYAANSILILLPQFCCIFSLHW